MTGKPHPPGGSLFVSLLSPPYGRKRERREKTPNGGAGLQGNERHPAGRGEYSHTRAGMERN